ncbi:MAG: hypothetical protein ABI306_06160 [Caulobacteraceae bacterium]
MRLQPLGHLTITNARHEGARNLYAWSPGEAGRVRLQPLGHLTITDKGRDTPDCGRRAIYAS